MSIIISTLCTLATHNINKLLAKYTISSATFSKIEYIQNKAICVHIFGISKPILVKLIHDELQTLSMNVSIYDEAAQNTEKPRLNISIPSSSLVPIIFKQQDILTNIKIEGDVSLAGNLAQLFEYLNIGLDDILALNLPSPISHIAYKFIQKINSKIPQIKASHAKFMLKASEYLMYDSQNLVSKKELKYFSEDVQHISIKLDALMHKISAIKLKS
jgi:ubiquinone biosynthesis protein UbiJ